MDPWIVLPVLALLAVLFVMVPVGLAVWARYAGRKLTRCPVSKREAIIEVDATRAGLAAAFGRRAVRLTACSLLPERWACARGCLGEETEALRDAPNAAA